MHIKPPNSLHIFSLFVNNINIFGFFSKGCDYIIFYIYRDKYNYLHAVSYFINKESILNYTKILKTTSYDIGSGGFPKITIDNVNYLILDNSKSIQLLNNNKFTTPTKAQLNMIYKLYKTIGIN